jgi:hypothetical protein
MDPEIAIMEKQEKSQKKDTSKSDDSKLDDALEDSFPASDPPSQTDPLSVGKRNAPHQQPPKAK